MTTRIPKGKIGYGFCSYVAPGTKILATHDTGSRRLALFPELRVEGYAASFRIGMINEMVLMGTIDEVETYKGELIKLGTDASRVSFLVTSNTTIGNAHDMHADLERQRLKDDDWILLTSDYHLRRAKLTALIRHNIAVRHAFGAESCLKFEAYELGGKPAMEAKTMEIISRIDPVDFLNRMAWERNGCEQIIADANAYAADK